MSEKYKISIMNAYAGIGSRSTPLNICNLMTDIAEFLFNKDYILYSGGALGADKAFEKGVKDNKYKRIFLPWKNYNGNKSPYYIVDQRALDFAKKFHPSWDYLNYYAKKLIARNSYQILGPGLEKPVVEFVICYTLEGKIKGGTGQAIRIANHFKIPVYNLYHKYDRDRIRKWISEDEINIENEEELESWVLN